MSPGLTADLAFAGGVVFLAAWLLLWRSVGWHVALVLAFLRVGLAVVYFGYWDDGSWRLLDDLNYTEDSLELGDSAGGAAAVLLDPEAGTLLSSAAGGRHFGYYAYNLVGFALFGNHYWSPVMLNVLLSFVAALGLLSVARSSGFGPGVRVPLAAAFLLHPDVVAWSGFFNLKDTLVMTLSVWLFALMLRSMRRRSGFNCALATALGALLFVVRSYAVVLIAAALLSWVVLYGKGILRVGLFGLAALAIPFVPRGGLEYFVPKNVPVGLVDFLLTPRPWGLVRDYRFLLVSSTVHWLLAPVALWGLIWLWRKGNKYAHLPLVYGAILVTFYACVPLLAGPRHRFQMVFLLVAAQLAGLYALADEFLGRRMGLWRPSEVRISPGPRDDREAPQLERLGI